MNLYQHYLAADRATKRLASIGLSVESVFFDSSPLTAGESADGVPLTYVWPHVRIEINFSRSFEDFWLKPDEERQAIREQAIREFAARYADVKVFRDGGNAYIYFEAAPGVGVRIAFGQALCEQVQVGTRTVTRPIEDAPTIEVEEPVFEWRCNDAELPVIGGAR